MTKSALQIERAHYVPKMPTALRGAVKAVDGEYTESVANQEEIKKLFPNTYGMPVVTFEKSDAADQRRRDIVGRTGAGRPQRDCRTVRRAEIGKQRFSPVRIHPRAGRSDRA